MSMQIGCVGGYYVNTVHNIYSSAKDVFNYISFIFVCEKPNKTAIQLILYVFNQTNPDPSTNGVSTKVAMNNYHFHCSSPRAIVRSL